MAEHSMLAFVKADECALSRAEKLMPTDHHDVTDILAAWQQGDAKAGERLMERVYRELHRMAAGYLRGERPGHTLQATALVHEAYMRLLGNQTVEWSNRAQFFGLAARAMRRILVEHARARGSMKRGGGALRIPFEEVENLCQGRPEEILALDAALESFHEIDPQKARIVELRYFGGFEVQEIAQLLEVSIPTVNRHWRMARAWLAAELQPRSLR